MSSEIRFDDGVAYEQYMGKWSQLAGEAFLSWLSPDAGWHWLDVGCGNGAFTELLMARCAPSRIQGVDPSEQQLAYARARATMSQVEWHCGDAMALPFSDNTFDAAVMPLVIFFVPEPSRGVAEMVRTVVPGGSVSAYAWDMLGGGFPYESLQAEIRRMGVTVPTAPSTDASRLENLRVLWESAGLLHVETHVLEVERTFASFDDYWQTVRGAPSVGLKVSVMSAGQVADLQARMKAKMLTDAKGRIVCRAIANAVKGRVPAV